MNYSCKTNVFVTELSDRLALLDMETGTYFSLNQSGTLIWSKLTENKSVSEIADALIEEYEISRDQALQDSKNLIEELVSQGLVVADDQSPSR